MAFDREEMEAAFAKYQQDVAEMSRTMDFKAWLEKTFTDDAEYIDRGLGSAKGLANILAWMGGLAEAMPDVLSYRSDWHVIDGDRVVSYHHDGFPDPTTGVPYDCPVVSILRYAGDGRWSYEEDVYNPKEFEAALAAYLAAKKAANA